MSIQSTADAVYQSAVAPNTAQEAQYQTGWWNEVTGGRKEKASAIAMADVDRQYQSKEALTNREWQAQEAQRNRDFQERLSNSAYQRMALDMKKAGLNPAMAYQHMGGASTPSGSTGGGAQGSGSRSTPPMSSTGQLVSLIAGAVGGAVMATAKASTAIKVAQHQKTFGVPFFKSGGRS